MLTCLSVWFENSNYLNPGFYLSSLFFIFALYWNKVQNCCCIALMLFPLHIHCRLVSCSADILLGGSSGQEKTLSFYGCTMVISSCVFYGSNGAHINSFMWHSTCLFDWVSYNMWNVIACVCPSLYYIFHAIVTIPIY